LADVMGPIAEGVLRGSHHLLGLHPVDLGRN